ncbi:ABC transporter ATP-binding protein [Anaerosporobacter faecicola]|uniref:ABC transporter ATP-binding protein n=1 Tax=Anaerosporobacter faecicola TaxID=2718714 RepID=UPI00143C64BB|nr:ABC transporter ATP-binding protein [Anaerosporobacter faecicola]
MSPWKTCSNGYIGEFVFHKKVTRSLKGQGDCMVEIQELCKKYGTHIVLDNMNLHIERGQTYGLVGPNGVGKTTLIKILAGLLEPEYGRIKIGGKETTTKERRSNLKIGYMPDYFGVYQNLKLYEYMEFYAQMYGYRNKEIKNVIMEQLDLVHLTSKIEENVDILSRGMKQRLCLARCLLARPEVLLLDEPASGLDPRARKDICQILHHLQEQQITILISSHILQDLSKMCTHIGIMDGTKMVVQGPVEDILRIEEEAKPLCIRFTEVNANLFRYLESYALIQDLKVEGTQATMRFQGSEVEEANLLTQLIQNGAGICYFAREEGNLERIFLQITKGD